MGESLSGPQTVQNHTTQLPQLQSRWHPTLLCITVIQYDTAFCCNSTCPPQFHTKKIIHNAPSPHNSCGAATTANICNQKTLKQPSWQAAALPTLLCQTLTAATYTPFPNHNTPSSVDPHNPMVEEGPSKHSLQSHTKTNSVITATVTPVNAIWHPCITVHRTCAVLPCTLQVLLQHLCSTCPSTSAHIYFKNPSFTTPPAPTQLLQLLSDINIKPLTVLVPCGHGLNRAPPRCQPLTCSSLLHDNMGYCWNGFRLGTACKSPSPFPASLKPSLTQQWHVGVTSAHQPHAHYVLLRCGGSSIIHEGHAKMHCTMQPADGRRQCNVLCSMQRMLQTGRSRVEGGGSHRSANYRNTNHQKQISSPAVCSMFFVFSAATPSKPCLANMPMVWQQHQHNSSYIILKLESGSSFHMATSGCSSGSSSSKKNPLLQLKM